MPLPAQVCSPSGEDEIESPLGFQWYKERSYLFMHAMFWFTLFQENDMFGATQGIHLKPFKKTKIFKVQKKKDILSRSLWYGRNWKSKHLKYNFLCAYMYMHFNALCNLWHILSLHCPVLEWLSEKIFVALCLFNLEKHYRFAFQ